MKATGPLQNYAKYQTQLEEEILRSERVRVAILGAFFASLLLTFLILALFFPELFLLVYKGRMPPPLVFIGLGALTLFEAGKWFLLGYILQRRLRPPKAIRYLNALLETSIPTVMLILVSHYLGIMTPLQALLGPAVFIYFLFIILSALRLDFWICAFTGLVAAVEYLGLYYYSRPFFEATDPIMVLPGHHIAKALFMAVCGLIAGLVTSRLSQRFLQVVHSVEERNQIVGMFGQYVSPEVVEQLLRQKKELTSEMRHVCVMFLDIRGFTRFSEQREPVEVVNYLNSLWAFSIEIVNRHHGFVNKFLGDGFMAIFGAPLSNGNDSHNAVAAALEILQRVEQESQRKDIHPTRIGIGLHAGEAITGNIGSPLRKEYTIIGDVVNLAARIEQLNKRYESHCLVSEAVWQALSPADRQGESLGMVEVKGRREPVHIYRLA